MKIDKTCRWKSRQQRSRTLTDYTPRRSKRSRERPNRRCKDEIENFTGKPWKILPQCRDSRKRLRRPLSASGVTIPDEDEKFKGKHKCFSPGSLLLTGQRNENWIMRDCFSHVCWAAIKDSRPLTEAWHSGDVLGKQSQVRDVHLPHPQSYIQHFSANTQRDQY